MNYINIYIIVLTLLVLIGISSRSKNHETIKNQEVINAMDTIIISDSIDFSRKELKKYIKHLNLKHPDIVYAQAVLESGNFNSYIFKNNNNIFGMKEAQVRNNTARGSVNGHAYYSNWRQSVIDYALFQSTYMRKLNREEYFRYLDRNYARDPNYSKKLRQIIKRHE